MFNMLLVKVPYLLFCGVQTYWHVANIKNLLPCILSDSPQFEKKCALHMKSADSDYKTTIYLMIFLIIKWICSLFTIKIVVRNI